MNMAEYLTEHWILSIVVTIVLGGIGSGLWDAALKPISKRLGGVLYTLITFGAKRARDNIYKEASKGHHELPSLLLLIIILTVGASTMIVFYGAIYQMLFAPESNRIVRINVEQCSKLPEPNQQYECVKSIMKEDLTPTFQLSMLAGVFLIFLIFYQLIKINRVNLVTTNYQQCLKAVRPFLDERDAFLIEQRYAIMTTKSEYDAIIEQMAAVAKSNSTSLP